MSWSRENPRFRRSSALTRRKKKKGLFTRLDSWWRSRKETSRLEAEAENARHRPDPPVPPELMDELKIAVPRPKAPKPKPAPRVCPPPTPGLATAFKPAEAPTESVTVKATGRRKIRRSSLATLDQAPPEGSLAQAYLTEPPDGVEGEAKTLKPTASSPALDDLDDDYFTKARQGWKKGPKTVLGPNESMTELLRPEKPAEDDSLLEEASTVVPAAVELDRATVRTIPASIYQDQSPESGPVRVVGSAGDSDSEPAWADEAPSIGSAPRLEGEPSSEADDLNDSADILAEGVPDLTEEAGPAPLTATSRREGTVNHSRLKSSRQRPENRLGDALGRSALLRWSLVIGLIGLLAGGLALGWSYYSQPAAPGRAKVARIPAAILPKVAPLAPGFYEIYARQRESAVQTEATIGQGSGLGQALEAVGLGARQRSAAIIECLTRDGGINPNAVRAGVSLKAFWADRGRNELRRLEYHPENGAAPLVVMPRADGGFWLYNTASPPLTLNAAREGVVESSLWQAGSEAGLDASVILSLSDILASDVDFFNDIKTGDSFQVLYSRDYRDGRPQGAPIIDMVKLVNKGRAFEYYRFVGQGDKVGYYDTEGRTSHKAFFVTPLQYKRISSNFTMKRLHPIHRVVRPHQGVDYAAPSGTPISAVADGTVIFADWNGGYGRLVTIKHDETYTTMYAHMSRFAPGIKKGVKVKQGDLIGHVGATGTATGPHLDFRLKKNGTFIDPVPELAKQQGRKLESGDFIDLTKVIGLARERMKEQLAASQSGV